MTVTFDENYDHIPPAYQNVGTGERIILPSPVRNGYFCIGWYTDSDGVDYAGSPGEWMIPFHDTILYAQWIMVGDDPAVKDYVYTIDENNITIIKYTGTDEKITIPAEIEGRDVTVIGKDAFKNITSLISVTLPNNIVEIGEMSFYGCENLTFISIPDSAATIGDWAFAACSSLTSISIPFGVNIIGRSAFINCAGLNTITIPDSVVTIGEWLFAGCTGLTSVVLSQNISKIPDFAFLNCNKLTTVTIPKSVIEIGMGAFGNCGSLSSVYFEGDSPVIGSEAFGGGSLSMQGGTAIFLYCATALCGHSMLCI